MRCFLCFTISKLILIVINAQELPLKKNSYGSDLIRFFPHNLLNNDETKNAENDVTTRKPKGQRKINERIAWCRARLQEISNRNKTIKETGKQRKKRRSEYAKLVKEVRADKQRRRKIRKRRKKHRERIASQSLNQENSPSQLYPITYGEKNLYDVNPSNEHYRRYIDKSVTHNRTTGKITNNRRIRPPRSSPSIRKQKSGQLELVQKTTKTSKFSEKLKNVKQNVEKHAQKIFNGLSLFGKSFGEGIASGKINIANLLTAANFTKLGTYSKHTLACLANCGVTVFDLKKMSILDHTKKWVNCFHRHRDGACKDLFEYGLLKLPVFGPEILGFINNFLGAETVAPSYGGYGSSYGTGAYGTGYGDTYGQSSYAQPSYVPPAYPAAPYQEAY